MTEEFDTARHAAALSRLDALSPQPWADLLADGLTRAADPDLALASLERWLRARTSPESAAEELQAAPPLTSLLLRLMGAGAALADVLVQNPELASIILHPALVTQVPTLASVEQEGRRLLAGAQSYPHRLDRLRLVKQLMTVRIAALDLGGLCPPAEVWTALSQTAEALILLAWETAWQDYSAGRDLPSETPFRIVGMGKLGGEELNYSSDIDLIFVAPSSLPDSLENHALRAGEKLLRALSDRMGRGQLYRVDMRLRPYGRSGPLIVRMKAMEAYAERYAEPWEHMALIRSRVLGPTCEVSEAWEAMRRRSAFEKPRSEAAVDSILAMWDRTEELGGEADLKRGPGGIRDVEFTAQILQLLHARSRPAIRVRATLAALNALAEEGVIPHEAAAALSEGFVFLRQVEHRLQMEDDQQTHTLPSALPALERLARRFDALTLSEFQSQLSHHRQRVRHWRLELAPHAQQDDAVRTKALQLAGDSSAELAAWIDAMADSSAFYESLLQNRDSLLRTARLASLAPALSSFLGMSNSVTEEVLSGELLEGSESNLGRFRPAKDAEQDARRIRRTWIRCAARAALDPTFDFGLAWSQAVDRLLGSLAPPGLTVVALGSWAGLELSLFSDCDLLLMRERGEGGEEDAQRFAALVQERRGHGSPVQIDLRLRPEGRKGALVVTRAALERYVRTRLEPWEKLALSRSRHVAGPAEPIDWLQELVLREPLTSDELASLIAMKQRIETERVAWNERARHLKLGPGGQDDILWCIHLRLLADPQLRSLAGPSALEELTALGSGGGLRMEEAKDLTEAWLFWSRLRLHCGLLGVKDSLLPVEGDKLDRLAQAVEEGSGAALQERVSGLQARVRSIYLATVEDLKARC